jgi:hypothetical protein
MCCRHFHGYITLLFTGTWSPSHPPRKPFSATGSIMSACCQSSNSRSNLWNSAVSTRLHRTVWPALAQIRTKLTNNWDTLSIYIPSTIKSHQQEVHFAAWRVFWTAYLPLIIRYVRRYLLILFFYSARTTSSPITHLFTSFFSSYVLFVSSSLSSVCRSGKTEPSGSKMKICTLSGK